MQLSVLWMLSVFSPESGGTWVVPRSHRDPLNPRMHQTPEGLEEHIDQLKSIPGEIQVSGPAGSALVIDSRIWHSAGANPGPEPRVAVITRYCPWWLSLEFGRRNNAIVPEATYDALPEAVKPLFRHQAEGMDNPFRG
jgi:ectoine hydroxylase-related dioxygenase (phytanoyl-CoA dioxygenase family)